MAAEQSGDPGRTPGSAEGDRETIEEDLLEKQGSGKDAGSGISKQEPDKRLAVPNPTEVGKQVQ